MTIPDNFLLEIEQSYTKTNLEQFYNAFLKEFLRKNKELAERHGVNTALLSKKKLAKKDLIDTFATVLYSKELFEVMRNAMPLPLPQVWETLLLEGPVMQYELEKKYGVKIAKEKGSYGYEIEIDPLFLCFPYRAERNYYAFGDEPKIKVLFALPPVMRSCLVSQSPVPDKYKLSPIPAPASTAFLYEDKHQILEEFTLFLAYYQQGDLKFASSGKPQASSINKMRKFCNSREFFPDEKERKELVSLRTQLMAEALPLTGKVKELTENVPNLLKRIVRNFADGQMSVIYSLLFHLKGAGYVKNNYEDRLVNQELVTILSSLPAGEWYEIENLRRHISIYYQPLQPVTYYTAQNYLYVEVIEKDKYGSYKERYVPSPGTYRDMISYPLLKGTIYFAAALGLVDIAYDYPENEFMKDLGLEYVSVWDGLRYVRLNDLGAYVLGQKDTFEPPQREKSGELYLEEDLLIINYTGNDKVTTMMLEKVATKSTATRYKVDYVSFLKDCSKKKDIENKIEVFRTHIAAKPPRVWENFFQELVNKYNPLEKENNYRVFKIPPDNKELIALLARDEVLKKLVLKSEHYHVLVNEKDLAALRHRLEKFGFLLERGK